MSKNVKKPDPALKIPKVIIATGKFLAFISPKYAALFAAKLFATPLKHKIPKREYEMDSKSRQELVLIQSLNKPVMVYHYGNSPRKILLSHGWSGRGTQLAKIADALLESGYATVSFDAPAHGKSPGKTTLMPEFIETILQLEKDFGPFEAAIGHSLGGMSLLNAVRLGFRTKRLVTIGSGDIIQDIIDDFIEKLGLKADIGNRMRQHFEAKFGQTMDQYSAYLAAKQTEIPVLVIHDKNDDEVPVKCAYHIHENLPEGKLILTEGLGHRKILGNDAVIRAAVNFVNN